MKVRTLKLERMIFSAEWRGCCPLCQAFSFGKVPVTLQISHHSETYELQRFPVLRRRIEEVVANFLREGLAPAETMIGHLIEMEVSMPAFCMV